MAFHLCSESYRRSIRGGFLQHDYTRTYKGTVVNSSLVSTCHDATLPALGSSIVLEGIQYWAVEQIPRRQDDENGRQLAYVDIVYSNDTGSFERDVNGQPVTDAEDIAPYVQVQFHEGIEEISDARLSRIEDPTGTEVSMPPILASRANSDRKYAITNSAGAPVGTAQKKSFIKQLTYWTYHRTWDEDWESYNGNVNSAAFTLTQQDAGGVRSQNSVAAKCGLLAQIIREDHWKGDKLYFRRGCVILVDPRTWEHRQPDVGYAGAVFDGQYDWEAPTPSSTFTPSQLSSFQINNVRTTIYKQLKDSDDNLLTEPVRLNGFGAPHWTPRPGVIAAEKDSTFHLVYDKYDISDYATALGIS